MRPKSLALVCLAAQAAICQEAPRVISAGPGWLQGNAKLAKNLTLQPRPQLTGSVGTADLILDCGNRGSFLYQCVANGCSVPPCSETDSAGTGVSVHRLAFRGLTEMFSKLGRREPAELSVAGVRGSGGPSDAVVMQTTQGVHWAPALTRVLDGHYCFRLAHLPASTSSPSQTLVLDWDKSVEREGIAAVPNIAPGLYELEKGTPGTNPICRVDTNATPAWVLVVSQSAFQAVNKEWEDNLAQIDDLEQSGASTSTLTMLRHAILASLADPVEGK